MRTRTTRYNIQNNVIAWIHILFLIIVINKGSTTVCVNKQATQDTQYIYSHSGFNKVQKYPSNTDECWVIHADPDLFGTQVRVQLTMMYFDLEDSTNCTLDYVKIYSGENSDNGSHIIGTYCGEEPVSISVLSNSYNMYMSFITDNGKQFSGFKMKYKATIVNSHGNITGPVSVNGCYFLEAETATQTFYSHEGYLTEDYPSFYDACWIIHVSPDVPQPIYYMTSLGVQLWTTDFSVEYEANCALDYVTVYNGDNNVSAPLVKKLCGDITFVEYATDSFMFVQFHSDKSQVFSGFSMKYSTVLVDQYNSILQWPQIPYYIDSACTYLEATDEKKYFTSHPGYGETGYDGDDDGCWIIAVATNRSNDVVQIKSKGFKLESSTRNCRYDRLSFYDGFYYSSASSMGRYCNDSFHNQASTAQFMTIVFTTDCCDDYYPGFKLEYFAVDASLADRRNQFPFAGWKIALCVIAGIIGGVILIGLFLLLVCNEEIAKWWPTRTICRFNCMKKKDSEEADTEPDEVEGASAMNVIPSTTTVTDTPTSNTHSKAVPKSRYNKKKAKVSADRYKVRDSNSEEEDEEDNYRPPKKTKKKRRQRKVHDSSKINGTIEDPPPYATDIEDDPPPPYPTAPNEYDF